MIQSPVGESEINITEEEVEQLSAETKTFVNEFPKSFSIKGKYRSQNKNQNEGRRSNFPAKRKKNAHSNAKSGRCGNKKIAKRRPYRKNR